MSWQDGFKSGAVLTLGIVILTPIVQLIISEVITPDYFRNITEYSIEAGEMTRDEAEGYFNIQNYIFQSMVWAAVTGLITSAVVALILRRKVPNPHQVKGTTPYR
jgi:ethanolamine transporter EutH